MSIERTLNRLNNKIKCLQNSYYDSVDLFPKKGVVNKLYIDRSSGTSYIWNGSDYITNSGGIQSIQKGADISIDNTDPLNPIVNLDNALAAAITANTAKVSYDGSPNKRITATDINGTYALDHSVASHWVIEQDGDLILTDSNLPTGDYTGEFTMRIKKNGFVLEVPLYWGNVNGDEEDGTEWVYYAVQIENGNSGSEKCTMFLSNLV